jgi:hypothetical protein
MSDYQIHLKTHEICRQARKSIPLTVRQRFNRDILAFDKTGLGQALAKRAHEARGVRRRSVAQKPDNRLAWDRKLRGRVGGWRLRSGRRSAKMCRGR